jgi:DNA (cytosine-5)-methyltransferase 1
MRIGSLCTGYGGLDMAVEAFFDAETIWTCEFDKYASQVIKERINKTNHGDLKKTDWTKVEPIDILTAGYPCQPFSHAGSRKGANDERHLWPYIKEIIGILRPQFIVLENVRGHFGLGFREVLSDLATLRYDARWTLIRASDVGAPHRRERLFILAYPTHDTERKSIPSRFQSKNSKHCCYIIDEHTNTDGERCALGQDKSRTQGNQGQSQSIAYQLVKAIYNQEVPAPLVENRLNVKFVEYMMGLPNGWVTDVNLLNSQMLKILGNGVVPQQAYRALELLHSYPQGLSTGTPNLWETPKIHAVT